MLESLHYAFQRPEASGQIKYLPDDFCVEENLGFDLTGDGEHLYLLIERKLLNTEEMAKIIAKQFNMPLKRVSYAGLKDKFACTTQWFSLHLPGCDNPDLETLKSNDFRVLTHTRHNKKLKIGALKENRFTVTVRNFEYNPSELQARIAKVQTLGVPNYFGPQRFGNQGANLEKAKAVLFNHKVVKNPHLRGLYYSAARAFLFNHVLDLRIQEDCWHLPVEGDLLMLAGTNSVFHIDAVDECILQRISEGDITPAAALWGEGEEKLTKRALALQNKALTPWGDWCEALTQQGLRKSFRSMVLFPKDFRFQDNTFTFTLPKGSYATTVLRELLLTA